MAASTDGLDLAPYAGRWIAIVRGRVAGVGLSPEEARRNIGALLRHPWCRPLSEGEGFWETYEALASSLPVRGNLVPDAHLAAILLLHGVRTVYTNDTDFRKFQELEVRAPLAG